VISATMANGGRGRNVIPDVFELNLNHRFAPGTSAEAAQSYVRELVAGEAELEFTGRVSLGSAARTQPLVRLLAESGVAAVEPKQAWTDVARFAALRCSRGQLWSRPLRRKPTRRTNGRSSHCSMVAATSCAVGSVKSLLARTDVL